MQTQLRVKDISFHSVQHDGATWRRTKEDHRQDAWCACLASLISKRLRKLDRLEGPHLTFLDCWKDTFTGLYESKLEETERSRSLNASKKLISRLVQNESVLKRFEEELQEVVKSRDHEQQVGITESSSTGSRAERAAANRERRWRNLTTQVYNGEISPQSCQRQLRNKY